MRTTQEAMAAHLDAGNTLISETRLAVLITDPLKPELQLLSFTPLYGSELEKEMATHSSVLAWRIPGLGKPGGLPSMGSHRVRHD